MKDDNGILRLRLANSHHIGKSSSICVENYINVDIHYNDSGETELLIRAPCFNRDDKRVILTNMVFASGIAGKKLTLKSFDNAKCLTIREDGVNAFDPSDANEELKRYIDDPNKDIHVSSTTKIKDIIAEIRDYKLKNSMYLENYM